MRLSIYEKHIEEIRVFTKKTLIPTLQEALECLNNSHKCWNHWSDNPPVTDGKLKVYPMLTKGKDGQEMTNSVVLGAVGCRIIQVSLRGEKVFPESINPGGYLRQDYSERHINLLIRACRHFNKSAFLDSCEDSALSS